MTTNRKTKKKPVPQYAQFSLAEGAENKDIEYSQLLPLWVYDHFDWYGNDYHARSNDDVI